MAVRVSSFVNIIFRLCCWIATISMICVWLFKYHLNEDLCEVDYRNYYQTKDDLAPVLSLCFNRPFSLENLKKFGTGVNESTYLKFLEGKYFDSKLLDIDFKSVMLNVSRYVGAYWITWRNGSYIVDLSSAESAAFMEPSYSGFIEYAGLVNCFALKLPNSVDMKNVSNFGVMISYKIFPSGKRPLSHGLDTLIHYPNQILRSLKTQKYGWDPVSKDREITMRFRIQSMEIVKHRNKKNQKCHEEWKNDDDRILIKHTKDVGCSAPYQTVSSSIKKCTTREKLTESKFTLATSGYNSIPPCKTIGQIHFTYEESDYNSSSSLSGDNSGNFWIGIWLTGQQFKEIVKTR